MKKITLFILIITQFLCGYAYSSETELLKIRTAARNSKNMQVFMTFSEAPKFQHILKGKRIDIVIDGYLSNSSPVSFTTDDRIVKFLTQQRQEKTILTFFLRYEPQRYSVNSQDDKTLVLDILLGNQFTKAYPELSSKLKGLTIINEEGADFANPTTTNPYTQNWRSFFSRYAPKIKTNAPLKLAAPPFPIIELLPDVVASDILPGETFELAANEQWEEITPILLNQINITTDIETKKLLALTSGEVLFHSGDFENGFKQLYLLRDKYKDEYLGIAAAYLLARLRAEYEDIYIADYEYRGLDEHIDNSFALSPFIHISQLESALATNQLNRVHKLLKQDNIALPDKLAMTKELRQSDYWFATNNLIKAYVGYQLFEEKSFLDDQPFSLNGYCNTLFSQKKFKEASACFSKLSSKIETKEELSMISLKKAMAELNFKSAREMYVIFSSIEDAYPGTSAGFRAALKKTDIHYLSQPSWRKTSIKYYSAFAEKATDRNIAEEAALKEAIAQHELDNDAEAINLLLDFLRNYRAGSLTPTATALLIEILPAQLSKLLNDKNYVEALVLAKKNRNLFQENWLDINLLGLLAKAYHELSIYDEAGKLYLYLLSRADEKEKEKYYLPLISILHEQEDFDLVEDYAIQYFYNYPKGTDHNQILLYRLRSLISDGKETQALELLSGDLPQMIEIDELAASLYFRNDKYLETIECLDKHHSINQITDMDLLFILAESYYQEKLQDKAEKLFEQVEEVSKFRDQSKYRLSIIAKNKGETDNALKLLGEIVEKGNDPLWIKLAQKELEFHNLAGKY